MGQAFDGAGNVLGEAYGATKREVFDKLNLAHKDAAEIRIKAGRIMRLLSLGMPVVFVDAVGKARPALVTAIWAQGGTTDGTETEHNSRGTYVSSTPQTPAINVVVVTGDPSRYDEFGRQTERFTSITHATNNSAPGNYWRHADETPKITER